MKVSKVNAYDFNNIDDTVSSEELKTVLNDYSKHHNRKKKLNQELEKKYNLFSEKDKEINKHINSFINKIKNINERIEKLEQLTDEKKKYILESL